MVGPPSVTYAGAAPQSPRPCHGSPGHDRRNRRWREPFAPQGGRRSPPETERHQECKEPNHAPSLEPRATCPLCNTTICDTTTSSRSNIKTWNWRAFSPAHAGLTTRSQHIESYHEMHEMFVRSSTSCDRAKQDRSPLATSRRPILEPVRIPLRDDDERIAATDAVEAGRRDRGLELVEVGDVADDHRG